MEFLKDWIKFFGLFSIFVGFFMLNISLFVFCHPLVAIVGVIILYSTAGTIIIRL